ncbi:MAG TPA: PQQ-binding-like beta-propeller repeat protein [Candidatus Methanofastidiosa archaeon]|nr:PQQ-binding-like beta-propeller repeat protein [Candidatus Methanofastidiosa archaeon]
MVAVSCAGCMSGGDDDINTTTAAPSTAPDTTAAPTTVAPTTSAPSVTSAPPMVHSECSTGYINFDEGNGRYYPCDSPDDPEEVWSTDILMTEGPVLVDYDRAYLFQSNYGTYEIKCYDVNTGEEYWYIETPFMSLEDVLLKDGNLYMFQFDQPILHCYDAEDGSLLWSSLNVLDLYPEKYDIDLINMSYSNGKILALMLPYDDITDWGGSILCCFNGTNGQLIWDFFTEDDFRTYPAIGNGNAYYTVALNDARYDASGNYAEALVGIDIDNGDYVLNTIKQEYEYNQSDLIFSGGRLYTLVTRMDEAGHDGVPSVFNKYVMCFSTSGNQLWEEKLDGMTWYNLLLGNDKLFISSGSQIICYDVSTHEDLWKLSIEHNLYNAPIITNDKLILFRSDIGATQQVIALDPENGSELWSLDLEGLQISDSATFYENMMLVATNMGYLYCFA